MTFSTSSLVSSVLILLSIFFKKNLLCPWVSLLYFFRWLVFLLDLNHHLVLIQELPELLALYKDFTTPIALLFH